MLRVRELFFGRFRYGLFAVIRVILSNVQLVALNGHWQAASRCFDHERPLLLAAGIRQIRFDVREADEAAAFA